MKIDDVRKMALALPEVTEEDHFGVPSFRFKKKILVTVPDNKTVNVLLDAEYVDLALEAAPSVCDEVWWGKNRLGVSFKVAKAPRGLLKEMIEQSWRRRATKTLIKKFDNGEI